MGYFLLCFLACSLFVLGQGETSMPIEAEDLVEGKKAVATVMARSAASQKKSVSMLKNDVLTWCFCATSDFFISVSDLRYSNDGGSDRVDVLVDEVTLGEVGTVSGNSWGEMWNIFYSSGAVGKARKFPAGFHILYLFVKDSDAYGVELDRVDLKLNLFQGGAIYNSTQCSAGDCRSRAAATDTAGEISKHRSHRVHREEESLSDVQRRHVQEEEELLGLQRQKTITE